MATNATMESVIKQTRIINNQGLARQTTSPRQQNRPHSRIRAPMSLLERNYRGLNGEIYIKESRCPSYSLHKVHNLLRYRCSDRKAIKPEKTQSCQTSKLESVSPLPSVITSKLPGFYINKPDCLQYSLSRIDNLS